MSKKLYFNGTILTMDDACPRADYVLTEDNRILAAGGKQDIPDALSAGAQPVNLQGRVLLPGFIDSHLHMLTAALNRLKLDISDRHFASVEDMLSYVRREKEGSGEAWISVFGFSEENLDDGRMVTRRDIDKVFPDVPVTIIRVCGHMCIINSQVIARLDPEKMESIQGGAFVKDASGAYTGLATEGAQQYVLDSMPEVDPEVVQRYLLQEQDLLLRCGITAIHDAGTDMMLPRAYVEAYEEMERRDALRLRTYLMVRPGDGEPAEEFDRWLTDLKARHPAGRLKIGSVKLFADGSFGSRTAAVNEPYQGQPDNTGLLLQHRLDTYTTYLADRGHQVAVHAIGDRATGYVASLYAASTGKDTARLRIEHAELLDDALLDTILRNHLLIMTQPIFIREFGTTYFNNLGPQRAMHIQPLRTMLDRGIRVGFGTDYPVDDPNPLLGIHTAMTREIKNSDRLLNPAEAITFEEAVRCYTLHNAIGSFDESSMGSIRAGKYADFVILSGIEPQEDGTVASVSSAQVEQTIIGGETVYSRA